MTHLYHGTRYLSAIKVADRIKCAESGDLHVSLTWSLNEAKYWAELPRDDDEGQGWIIVLDRMKLLENDYDLRLFHSSASDRDEKEVACYYDIINVSKYIVEIISVPTVEAA
jgi:hypothetical protein